MRVQTQLRDSGKMIKYWLTQLIIYQQQHYWATLEAINWVSMLTIWMTRQTFWCLIVYWQRQLRYSNCVLCPSLWLLETRGLWRAEQWCLLQASLQTHNTVNCSNISHDLSLSWWARIGPLHSRLAFHYSLHSRADLVRLFATLFTLFWHTSLRGAGRLSNLLLLL